MDESILQGDITVETQSKAEIVTSGVDQEDDLLTSTEKYMRNEMTIDQLRNIQHLYAQNLKAVELKFAEVEQSNRVSSPTKKPRKNWLHDILLGK
jgi:hypothetical protein